MIFVGRESELNELRRLYQAKTSSAIPEVERKCQLLELPRGYTLEKALISKFGPDRTLTESGYFHHYLCVEDFFT